MGKKRSAYQPDFQEHPEANVNAIGFVPAQSEVPSYLHAARKQRVMLGTVSELDERDTRGQPFATGFVKERAENRDVVRDGEGVVARSSGGGISSTFNATHTSGMDVAAFIVAFAVPGSFEKSAIAQGYDDAGQVGTSPSWLSAL